MEKGRGKKVNRDQLLIIKLYSLLLFMIPINWHALLKFNLSIKTESRKIKTENLEFGKQIIYFIGPKNLIKMV